MATPRQDIRILETKVVILGNTGVGKTSIVSKYVTNQFSPLIPATIGASFNVKTLSFDGWKVQMQIWDTAGQERFRSMAPMYYRGAHAAILVFDITSPESLDRVAEWVEELKQHVGSNMILVLAANKADLIDSVANNAGQTLFKQAQQYADSIGAALFKTSAKSGNGVEDLFGWMGKQLLDTRLEAEKFAADKPGKDEGSYNQSSGGCCS